MKKTIWRILFDMLNKNKAEENKKKEKEMTEWSEIWAN